MTLWIDPPPPPSTPTIDAALHPLVRQALARRGINGAEQVRAFLDPDSYQPSPSAELPGLPAAADRIVGAIRSGQPICVWGDFDVDGQTATTVLVQTLQAIGADVTFHIPVRATEGHGVHVKTLAGIIDRGAQLILTCDTGITGHDAVAYARSRGVDVIVTDHHDLPPQLPQALAVVNPKLLPPEHPLATLSGVGVAYKLAEVLLDDGRSTADDRASSIVPRLSSNDLLDLVALGLVADLAVLRGDARYLVQKGLSALRGTTRLGLKVIMETAELVPANLTEEHIGFVIAPRLNALGRLGDANPAVELLTTSNPGRARLLAAQLENYNAQRQLLCNQVTEAAEAQLRAEPALLLSPILILAHPAWPGGVVGIVASRLVDRYHKPAILFSSAEGEPARGSARSVEGLNITAAIAANRDLLLDFGGHPMAAGLSLEADKLPEFRRRMAKAVEAQLGTDQLEAALQIDGWLDLPELTLDLAAAIERLAPFGPGNERLVLGTRGLSLKSSVPIGRNKEHLKLAVSDAGGNKQSVLWWDGGSASLPEGQFDLAYTLRTSDFRGVRQVQLELLDFRNLEPAGPQIATRTVEIIDRRGVEDPLQILKDERTALGLVWAEGVDKKTTDGRDRTGLGPAPVLTIWTSPPSPEVLHAALEQVQPDKIFLFAMDPDSATLKTFLERLAGLIKFAINRRGGRVSVAELAAATAQRIDAVRKGVAWLVNQGQVNVESESEAELTLSAGDSGKDPAGAARLASEIQAMLEESAAYRAHLRKAEINTLL